MVVEPPGELGTEPLSESPELQIFRKLPSNQFQRCKNRFGFFLSAYTKISVKERLQSKF